MLIKPVHEKTIWVPTRSNTNRAVQSQKKARNFGLKKKRDNTICVAKTKTPISCAYCTADLHLCFCICWLSQEAAQILKQNMLIETKHAYYNNYMYCDRKSYLYCEYKYDIIQSKQKPPLWYSKATHFGNQQSSVWS